MSEVTTVEEASRCPKCDNPGLKVAENKSRNSRNRMATFITFQCDTELCRWYRTTWIVQVNDDGTVPVRDAGPKQFPEFTPTQEAVGRRQVEEVIQADLRRS